MDSIDYYNKYAAKEFEETVNQDMSEIMWAVGQEETALRFMNWDMM
ncbi:MAG: hypothetical protein K0R23_3653 [Lacrimispora sp.]|nr:hypothetical protein [Lacrimispora sp.]